MEDSEAEIRGISFTGDHGERSASVPVSSSEEDHDLKPFMTRREKLSVLLHSHKFQVSVIILVVLDCLLVIAEMLFDLKMLEVHEEKYDTIAHTLHYLSVAILSIFIIEIIAKLYAFGISFFYHKLEVFDAFVVLLSFALDVAYMNHSSGVVSGLGLVIVMRLWRVARVLNGVVMSVKTQSEHKLLKERKLRENIEQEMLQSKQYTSVLENEIYHLHQILRQHNIKLPPTAVDMSALPDSVTKVVAEVNTNLDVN